MWHLKCDGGAERPSPWPAFWHETFEMPQHFDVASYQVMVERRGPAHGLALWHGMEIGHDLAL
eukprot:1150961-Pelagomonas_calceolata.AAC.12